MLNITLKQMEVFVCVAQERSFSAAAEKLFLSQSTVSAHIAEFESALGVSLMKRGSRRRVELTEQGMAVYRQCAGILDNCVSLEHSCSPEGTELAIGASTVPMDYILPQLLSAFRDTVPDCSFVLRRGNSAAVHDMLRSGEIVLGVVGTALDRPQLAYRKLCEDRLVVVTPNTQEYRELNTSGVLGKALLNRPMIVRTGGSGTQLAADAWFSSMGIPGDYIKVVARIESNTAILEAVANGLGIAVLSALAADDWIKNGKILSFEPDSIPVARDIYLAFSKKAPIPRFAKEFIDFSVHYMQKRL